jgi:hypothetical protein
MVVAALDDVDGVDLHIAEVSTAAAVAAGPSTNGVCASSCWARSEMRLAAALLREKGAFSRRTSRGM